jgi:hypothetical protein
VKYLFYKTTCLVTDKFYYGVHLERKKNDGYIGCGVKSQSTAVCLKKSGVKSAFIDSVIKYGYYNFKRETIAEYDTAAEAYLHEAQVVTRELIADPMCLNLKLGGYDGKTERLSRPISIVNVLNGQVFDFDSHTACNAFLGLVDMRYYSRVVGKHYVIKGKEIPISLVNPDGVVIHFIDIVAAKIYAGLTMSRINDLITGNRKTAKGWALSAKQNNLLSL